MWQSTGPIAFCKPTGKTAFSVLKVKSAAVKGELLQLIRDWNVEFPDAAASMTNNQLLQQLQSEHEMWTLCVSQGQPPPANAVMF